MTDPAPSRTRTPSTRRPPRTLGANAVALVLLTASILGWLVYQSASSSSAPSSDVVLGVEHGTPGTAMDDGAPDRTPDLEHQPTEADGVVPEGVSVFDAAYPAVTGLDPDLLAALRDASTDARTQGIELYVNSGWRSPAYQNQLLREAVDEYGSEEEAARWVATADTSLHVSGDAVDIGSFDAAAWLSKRGARYGLCQVYDNEPWHFELRPEAVNDGCPRTYADPTHDPRMR